VDKTYHFRLTRHDVEAAVLYGVSADAILQFLQSYSRTPIPQNVEYSIRDWASKVQVARTFEAVVLEVRDAATLDALMADPQVRAHVVRRLSPTLAVVKGRITSKKLIAHLRESGIFFRS